MKLQSAGVVGLQSIRPSEPRTMRCGSGDFSWSSGLRSGTLRLISAGAANDVALVHPAALPSARRWAKFRVSSRWVKAPYFQREFESLSLRQSEV
jgi:hypothetical protein